VPGYSTVHGWVRATRVKTSQHPCADCGRPAQGRSYDHGDPDEKIDERGRRYSLDLNRYTPRCSSCHAVFDDIGLRLAFARGGVKLSDEQVTQIRDAHAAGESCWSIARRLGVSEGYARDVALHRARLHVGG
jgi:hypothetical protein